MVPLQVDLLFDPSQQQVQLKLPALLLEVVEEAVYLYEELVLEAD